jgi:FixJ family two-component response regulator
METEISTREEYMSQIITYENIATLARKIVNSVLRGCRNIKIAWNLMKGLQADWLSRNNINHNLSIANDLIQSAIIFYFDFIGQRLNTATGKFDRRKRPITVYLACYQSLNREIYQIKKESETENTDDYQMFATTVRNTAQELQELDDIIQQLHLTEKQRYVLDCRLNGQGYTIIGKQMNTLPNTVIDHCYKIQRKFKQYLIDNNLFLQQCDICKRILGIFDYKPEEIKEPCYCKKCGQGYI